jgi:hypothetical protein
MRTVQAKVVDKIKQIRYNVFKTSFENIAVNETM